MTMQNPQTCLSAELLRQLSHDELSPAELKDVEDHVSDCERCRQLLEVPQSDSHWQDEIVPLLRTPLESPHVAGDHDERGCEGESLESILRLLGPTDDPHMLGRIGCYEVVGVIGRGGMGVVFKAYEGALNRFVAIKMLLPHLAASGAARKRFAREGKAAAAVIDDNVMPIYSVAEWQGVPYLVTQYSRGATLEKRIRDQGPLELKEILRIGMQTARGLAAAHAQGLVHRDVKPSNILLDGTVERALLTDFGLARAVDDASITKTGIIAGTPQYMSPEQARGGNVDARSDLFGLGCVLYAMCTGRPPFRADNSYAIMRMITDDEPHSIREINPDIPEWLCLLISRLMAKSPDDRFGNALEVAALLEQCLAHVQQPTSVPLPASLVTQVSGSRSHFNGAKNPMKTKPITDALFHVLRMFGDLLLGRGITAGWPIPIGPKPTWCLPLWALIVLPVWFFCFVTPIQTMFDITFLVPTANVKGRNEIYDVLTCAFQSLFFGLYAAQLSVAVTPSRFLRPLMSLWILVLPYGLARQVGQLAADWFGHVFSLVPARLTNETDSYLTIAIFSAIIYSFVMRREPRKSQQPQPRNDLPTMAPQVTRKAKIAVIATLGTISMISVGMILWQVATQAPDISGPWTSDEWGTVVLEAKGPGEYEGTFTGSGRDKPVPSNDPPVGGVGGVSRGSGLRINVPGMGPAPLALDFSGGGPDGLGVSPKSEPDALSDSDKTKSGTLDSESPQKFHSIIGVMVDGELKHYDSGANFPLPTVPLPTVRVLDKTKSGTVHLKWSRVERRFNGTWGKGADRSGTMSLRMVDKEIRGGFTTDEDVQLETGTPLVGDLLWKRSAVTVPDGGAVLLGGTDETDPSQLKIPLGDIRVDVYAGRSVWYLPEKEVDKLLHSFKSLRGVTVQVHEDGKGDAFTKAVVHDPAPVRDEPAENQKREERIRTIKIAIDEVLRAHKVPNIRWLDEIGNQQDGPVPTGLEQPPTPANMAEPPVAFGQLQRSLNVSQVLKEGRALNESREVVVVRFRVADARTESVRTDKDETWWVLSSEKAPYDNHPLSFRASITTKALDELKKNGVEDIAKHFVGKILDVEGPVQVTESSWSDIPGDPRMYPFYSTNVYNLDRIQETKAVSLPTIDGAKTLDRKNIRSVIEAYVAAALQGDHTTAASVAIVEGKPADPKQIEQQIQAISQSLKLKQLAMHSIHLNDCEHPTGALAISESVTHAEKQRNGERTGFVMLELIWVDEKWFVVGVEFRSEDAANKQLEQFLKANPKSISVPPQAAREAAKSPTGLADMKKLRDVLLKRVALLEKSLAAGETVPATVLTARDQLFQAELQLFTTKEERLAIHQKRLDNMCALEKVVKQLFDAKECSQDAMLSATAARLQAEIDLARVGETIPRSEISLDRQNARAVVEAFVAAAIAGDEMTINTLAPISRSQAGVELYVGELKFLKLAKLRIESVYVNDLAKPTKALATSVEVRLEGKTPRLHEPRGGFLVLTLSMSENGWFVTDIDLESEKTADRELKKFLEANPNAISVPPQASSEAAKPTTGLAEAKTVDTAPDGKPVAKPDWVIAWDFRYTLMNQRYAMMRISKDGKLEAIFPEQPLVRSQLTPEELAEIVDLVAKNPQSKTQPISMIADYSLAVRPRPELFEEIKRVNVRSEIVAAIHNGEILELDLNTRDSYVVGNHLWKLVGLAAIGGSKELPRFVEVANRELKRNFPNVSDEITSDQFSYGIVDRPSGNITIWFDFKIDSKAKIGKVVLRIPQDGQPSMEKVVLTELESPSPKPTEKSETSTELPPIPSTALPLIEKPKVDKVQDHDKPLSVEGHPRYPKLPIDRYVNSGVPLAEQTWPLPPWGEERDGLSVGLRVIDEARIGGEVKAELWVRNSSAMDVKFSQCLRADVGLSVVAKDKDGKEHSADITQFRGRPVFHHRLLASGHIVKVKEFNVKFGAGKNDKLEPGWVNLQLTPGDYKLRAEWSDTTSRGAAEGEWTGKLTTGEVDLKIAAANAGADARKPAAKLPDSAYAKVGIPIGELDKPIEWSGVVTEGLCMGIHVPEDAEWRVGGEVKAEVWVYNASETCSCQRGTS